MLAAGVYEPEDLERALDLPAEEWADQSGRIQELRDEAERLRARAFAVLPPGEGRRRLLSTVELLERKLESTRSTMAGLGLVWEHADAELEDIIEADQPVEVRIAPGFPAQQVDLTELGDLGILPLIPIIIGASIITTAIGGTVAVSKASDVVEDEIARRNRILDMVEAGGLSPSEVAEIEGRSSGGLLQKLFGVSPLVLIAGLAAVVMRHDIANLFRGLLGKKKRQRR